MTSTGSGTEGSRWSSSIVRSEFDEGNGVRLPMVKVDIGSVLSRVEIRAERVQVAGIRGRISKLWRPHHERVIYRLTSRRTSTLLSRTLT
jgi:hypothetical protein